jgi:cell division septum initiation protein DivIVA
MIANNIDGSSGGSSQILELLSLVAADPKVYQSKLKALEDATAEHKKYVELVGPASDILTIKAKVKADLDEAAKTLSEAKQQAADLIAEAKAQAKELVDAAKLTATGLKSDAKKALEVANITKSQAETAAAQAAQAQVEADSAIAQAEERVKSLDKAIAEAKVAKEAANAIKTEIIAKHKAFIESL